MAKLSREQILKVADLIKIHLDESDIVHYQEQLETVLDSVEVLKELDTDHITETSQTHGLLNVLDDDEPQEGLDISKYPNRANIEDGYFRVKKVL